MVNEKLRELLPPPELCEKIPKDCFQNSFFVWTKSMFNTKGDYELVSRDYFNKELPAWNNIPAPTFNELLEKLPSLDMRYTRRDKSKSSFSACFYDSTAPAVDGTNPAEVIMKLYLLYTGQMRWKEIE